MRYIFTLALLGINLVLAHSQILDPVKWSFDYQQTGEGEFELIYIATIDPHWAVYSQYLENDDGPVRTSFEYDPGDHFELVGKNQESGEKHEGYDPLFDMNVIKYKKKATFKQKVKVSDLSKPITGYLTFMTCDDTRCLPPTEVDYSFELKAKAATTGDAAPAPKSEPAKTSTEETKATAQTTELTASHSVEGEGILEPVKWSFSKEKVSDTEYDLIFRADLDEHWNLYSQHTSDEGPVPTTFYFDEGTHYERIGELTEEGKKKEGPDPLFDNVMVIKFVKGPVIFKQRVKVSDPNQRISGAVEFMTCDDKRCLPPTEEPFSFNLLAEGTDAGMDTGVDGTDLVAGGNPFDKHAIDQEWAGEDCGDELLKEGETEESSWWLIFLLGFGGGLFALLTPCVFPMIPLTVTFFTKSSTTRAKGISNAVTYGLSIIVIYVFLGLVITGIFGADALNLLSTNAWFNIFFALLFIIFAISFFGYFEITLPSAWATKSDQAADKGGLIGIFFMAFTLSLVSFSCTGPIIGTLLVETATGGGATVLGRIPVGPLMGMLGFSVALALPFALFAAFPSWLNSLPRSGGWMTGVKVTLAFVEVALALKFFSVADLTMGWKFMPYELFLGAWVLCAAGLMLYYLGILRFPHDSPLKKITPARWSLAGVMLVLAVYLSLGFRYSDQSETFTTPNLLSGLAPPAGHSYIYPKECPLNINCFKDFDQGLAYARKEGKPILLDFTGYGCVNCRRMEDNVWGQDGVFELISEEYVLVSLYVDDRKKLDEPYTSPYDGKLRTTVGNKWTDFQIVHFNSNAQPLYVLLSDDLKVLNQPKAYTPDKDEYQSFLECGLERFQAHKNGGSKLGIK